MPPIQANLLHQRYTIGPPSRELKKYSIDEVAEVSKISPRTIGRVRSGVAVSPKIIDALVDCLAVMSEGKSAKRGARRVAMA